MCLVHIHRDHPLYLVLGQLRTLVIHKKDGTVLLGTDKSCNLPSSASFARCQSSDSMLSYRTRSGSHLGSIISISSTKSSLFSPPPTVCQKTASRTLGKIWRQVRGHQRPATNIFPTSRKRWQQGKGRWSSGPMEG